jgi:transcriptional regulator with XRE-family HTH domain
MNIATKVQMTEEITETMAATLATIGERVRNARVARSMTLQDLADVSGVSPSMLSLVERGRASPSIGSLIVAMSDLIIADSSVQEGVVVRPADQRVIETAEHVVRRLLREDRKRAVSIAVNEYAPDTGSALTPLSHAGYEFGFVLEGKLTVEIDGASYKIEKGDLISYSSRRQHRIWNHGRRSARTLWFNLGND